LVIFGRVRELAEVEVRFHGHLDAVIANRPHVRPAQTKEQNLLFAILVSSLPRLRTLGRTRLASFNAISPQRLTELRLGAFIE
jgi:hypothetical protein